METKVHSPFWVKAISDNKPKSSDGLPFKKGQLIQVFEFRDKELKGKYDDKVGWFPQDRVQLLDGTGTSFVESEALKNLDFSKLTPGARKVFRKSCSTNFETR
eukprot:TRINITY_DN4901_c0_g1_i2.p1 TRINITY_DN4901_c0_g1~~TRINITY_DN4901_c0_g1_i2.p1  ORF type:complete len:103 (-),score=16.69 TRINITY_DN4901_c0_g1_i2:299-607(-)